MPFETKIRPIVEKHSAFAVERFRFAENFQEIHLKKIQRGIIFVVAAWSGPASVGLQRFTKILKPFAADSFDLVILDIDSLTADSAKELFGVPSFTTGGWGEAIWVCRGKIVARELTHTVLETLIEQHTKELLLS